MSIRGFWRIWICDLRPVPIQQTDDHHFLNPPNLLWISVDVRQRGENPQISAIKIHGHLLTKQTWLSVEIGDLSSRYLPCRYIRNGRIIHQADVDQERYNFVSSTVLMKCSVQTFFCMHGLIAKGSVEKIF